MSDARFARLRTDPRFRRPKKSAHKVVVDERFKAVFDDEKPGAKKSRSKAGRIDKYGRRIADSKEKNDLKRFYRLEGETQDKQEADVIPKIIDYARGEVMLESSDEDEDDEDEKEQEESDDDEVILGHHPSRPIPVLPDDEQLEIDLDEEDEAYIDLDAEATEYAKEHAEDDDEPNAVVTKTNRLAVVNLDWDHVRASHLYRIFSSLVSPTAARSSVTAASKNAEKGWLNSNGAKIVRGKLLSVRIYPSEFGKERMKREELEGPPKEIFKKTRRDDVLLSLHAEDEGDEFDEKALRKYQLERLRYYYAIAAFDSVEAASHVLTELEGTELERSANVFDLSFIPEDMTFDEEFRDEATSTTSSLDTDYKPLDFSTAALRHSKVSLKWDEDDTERNKVTRRALTRKEIDEGDYRAFIASSGSEGSDDEAEQKANKDKPDRDNLRKLLLSSKRDDLPEGWGADAFGSGDESADGDMEITFMPGLSEANNKEDETTLDKYKRKQKEKRQKRKLDRKEKSDETGSIEKKSKGVDDEFFGEDSDSEPETSEEETEKLPMTKGRKKHDEKRSTRAESRPATEAELELLIAPDDNAPQQKHFDMKSIIKAEKLKGKKWQKAQKGINADEMQEDFQIDVKDDRFKALHDDHAFAIDPSNPHFKKTKGMSALLDERSKKQQPGPRDIGDEATLVDNSGERSLKSLVDSVKRKSSQRDAKGVGKRRKT